MKTHIFCEPEFKHHIKLGSWSKQVQDCVHSSFSWQECWDWVRHKNVQEHTLIAQQGN